MKKVAYLFLFCALGFSSRAQTAKPEDVASMDAILTALYDVISGPAGEKRDWERMKSLFIPEGRLIPSGKNQQGDLVYRWWSVDEYIQTNGPALERSGFYETEIGRRVEEYGTIAHVFSTYETRRSASDKEPFMRGINSIQLLNDGKRWWIVSVMWMGENPQFPLPDKYLRK
ncbi:hypothetical protein [Roseivirga thermotolerans]|uniref:hypothetical protein n=1 Tax=Roseivirga thermotolerans TaxID=1758176 RepID=UPI00273EC2BD|nr:hypothetical protein [Roseivirga thermotolerans]MEC7755565.1 hypothetical protein [Bacteroidota bacterium]